MNEVQRASYSGTFSMIPLLFPQRELFEDEKGSGLVESWEGVARLFASVIDEKGGLAAILWLESEASHILQLGVPQS